MDLKQDQIIVKDYDWLVLACYGMLLVAYDTAAVGLTGAYKISQCYCPLWLYAKLCFRIVLIKQPCSCCLLLLQKCLLL
jgi:hypothetical protein